jgi:hypothetical protein
MGHSYCRRFFLVLVIHAEKPNTVCGKYTERIIKMVDHPHCELVLEHQKTVGELKANMETVKSQAVELFKMTRTLERTSLENQNGIEKIQDKLDNGINKVLENIAAEVTQISEANIQERVRAAADRIKDELGRNCAIKKDKLPGLLGFINKAWDDFIDHAGWILIALALWFALWAIGKTALFNELPYWLVRG